MTLTKNQKKWLLDVYQDEINEATEGSTYEDVLQYNCRSKDEAIIHKNNHEELDQYIEILNELKKKIEEIEPI